jgi:hypothetical protein
MGLFKSREQRRIEREMRIRAGVKSLERAIREQEKFTEDFIRSAQEARRIGDQQQYAFIRNSLKKTASVKRLLERQLLSVRSAMLIQKQAEASRQFAESMDIMSRAISRVFGELDLTRTQAQWERAVTQAGSIEQRMELFLESMEQAGATTTAAEGSLVTDEEIDRMINADVLAAEKAELARLDELENEISRELGSAKQRD